MRSREPQRLILETRRKGEVTGADIGLNEHVTVVNPQQHICTLRRETMFEMALEVQLGRGFSPGSEQRQPDLQPGIIPINALFSPVTRVRYAVENSRVGGRTDYDKLIIEIWTDGRITPEEALSEASFILAHHFEVLSGKDVIEFEKPAGDEETDQTRLKDLLNMEVNKLELSIRVTNCLREANIRTIGQLAMLTEQEMLKYRTFGEHSLKEIKASLAKIGLSLGMAFEAELIESATKDTANKVLPAPSD